jgi:hypothetical protein
MSVAIELFIKCYPTDKDAKHFPNSNFAIKPISVQEIISMSNTTQPNKQEGSEEIADFIPKSWKLIHRTGIPYKSNVYAIEAETPYQILQSETGNNAFIGSIDLNEGYDHVYQFPKDEKGAISRDNCFNRSVINVEAIVKMIESAPTMQAELIKLRESNEILMEELEEAKKQLEECDGKLTISIKALSNQ